MFDFVVEVLHALGHFLLVDRVVNVAIVQVGGAHVGLAVLVQFGRASSGPAVGSWKTRITQS